MNTITLHKHNQLQKQFQFIYTSVSHQSRVK